MKDTEKALKEELSNYFVGQGQRLWMMSKLILSVLKMCTVNFAQLALVLNPSVKNSSNFKRIQRFVKQYSFCRRRFVQWAWSQYGNQGAWICLSMDRTNWKFGRCNINILTIGISWRGTAIPLVWMMLSKRGQSNQGERILLLEQLLNCLDQKQKKRIRYLLMDREFAADEWLAYLKGRSIHFLIRIRKDAKVRKIGKLSDKAAWQLFQTDSFRVLRKQRILFRHRLYIGGQKISSNEYLILISDIPLKHATQLYRERWGIVVFFGCCKKRGFNF
ncbi:MAG: transposase [Bacteroidota bacterium]